MNPWARLESELKALNEQIEALRPEALVNAGFVLDCKTEGDRTYYRMRQKSGGRPGKMIRTIDQRQYRELQKQLANGYRLSRLLKQRDRLVRRMDAIATKAGCG